MSYTVRTERAIGGVGWRFIVIAEQTGVIATSTPRYPTEGDAEQAGRQRAAELAAKASGEEAVPA